VRARFATLEVERLLEKATEQEKAGEKYMPVLGGAPGSAVVVNQFPSPPVPVAVIVVQNSG